MIKINESFKIIFLFITGSIITVLFLIPIYSRAATVDATLLLNPSTASTTIGGSNINLVARVNPGSNTTDGVNAVQLDITFVPSVVHLVSITAASPFSTITTPDIATANASGAISVPLFIGGSQVTTLSNVATLVFSPQGIGSNSPIDFAETANAAVNDGSGTMVVATRTGTKITVISNGDITAPNLSNFTIPSTSISLVVPVTNFVATDATGVTGYILTESPSTPLASAVGWTASAPNSYTFSSAGEKTLYAWAKDAAGNISSSLNASVTITANETSPPIIANGIPTGKLSSSTSSVNLSVVTDENATCKFSSDVNIFYDSMPNTFTTTGGTMHTTAATGLKDDRSYTYYVRCRDTIGNTNASDYVVSFSVKEKNSSKKDTNKTKRKITNSKSSVSRGQVLFQKGKRFSKNSEVLLYFSKIGGGYYAPMKIKTSSTGKFSVAYRVSKPSGKYSWYALDTKTGKKSKVTSYIVK